VALMMAHFYAGKTEAAIAAGNKALAINPNNPDVLAKLAGVLYSSGFQKAAVTLAEEASDNVEAIPRDARIVMALDAYRREDWSNASLVSEQINCSDFVVRAIRAAALGQMASPDAGRSLAFLKEAMPDYKTAMRTLMERRRYPDEVIAGLEKGLGRAEMAEPKLASVAD
jgi:tetratricopeptide (TPR) repeat protein